MSENTGQVDIIGAIFGCVGDADPLNPDLSETLDTGASYDAIGDAYVGDTHEEMGEILGAIGVELSEKDIIGDDSVIGWSLSGMVRDVGRGLTSAAKAAKAVIKSPIAKVVAGGIALAFPPVGLPMATALVAADRAIAVAEGVRGTPKQQAVVRAAIKRSVEAAKRGDQDANRAVGMMHVARLVRQQQTRLQAKARRAKGSRGLLVTPGGRIERGTFLKA